VQPQLAFVHGRFLHRVLANPPCDSQTISFRQSILKELEEDPGVRERTEKLHAALHHLLALFRAARSDARLNHAAFRLEILRQARVVVETMASDFAGARSGLRRLHEVGLDIQRTEAWDLLISVLAYEGERGTLHVEVGIGADGRARTLVLRSLHENEGNRFYRGPLRRWLDLLRLFWNRASLDPQKIVDGVVFQVYMAIASAVRSLLQVMGHLEVYLAFMGFAEDARRRGLTVRPARCATAAGLRLEGLFNPLLLATVQQPVTCTVEADQGSRITIVTGPNSGGKTRLLQAVGLAQLLGQSGFYTPCAVARLPILQGLFVSLVDRGHANQEEGRLGTELMRIKTVFAAAPRRSMILLDELCSGTNPSEATEIVSLVLDLLGRLDPVAFLTTHFLSFADGLERSKGEQQMAFLQVEVDGERRPTYRFTQGVASTSLAAQTAERLGVTFEELAALVDSR
jgi:DNA mismatch repair protein MutS2